MNWLLRPRLSLLDGLVIVIGAHLLGTEQFLLGSLVLVGGPLLVMIIERVWSGT